ncbi:hypothetical protein CCMSSC00406_0007835 [Pleurotus cornucopiae]|uniref:Uncharacterized protein n=1 Tax=Pleurotus cornucopiae TaxID=5321 RepID=A0ACB7J595_PLECO|nr:hypothetical protein CCMSSC00406_0007835 [Pleurotus cornucopiae]
MNRYVGIKAVYKPSANHPTFSTLRHSHYLQSTVRHLLLPFLRATLTACTGINVSAVRVNVQTTQSTMRAALLVLAFVAVFVVASPGMEKRKKKAKRPTRPAAPPVPAPAVVADAAAAALLPF